MDFADFGRRKGVEVRFIEFMPLDAEEGWRAEAVVGLSEITQRIGEVFPVEPQQQGSEPASRFRYLDGKGSFGVVASVTRSFCGSCDRIRLTADGQFRNCLFGLHEYDLRAPLRSGAGDDEPGRDRARCRGSQVGGAQHREGALRAPQPLHVANRRMRATGRPLL